MKGLGLAELDPPGGMDFATRIWRAELRDAATV